MRMCRLACTLVILLLASGCGLIGFSKKSESFDPASHTSAASRPQFPISETGRTLFEQAMPLWNRQDVCSEPLHALALLDAALEHDPDFAEAMLWRGRALSDAGYHDDAFDDITRSIQLNPTALGYAARALVDLRLANNSGAARDIASALQLDASEPRAYVYRAAEFFIQGEIKAGCKDLAAACLHGMCLPEEKARQDGLCP